MSRGKTPIVPPRHTRKRLVPLAVNTLLGEGSSNAPAESREAFLEKDIALRKKKIEQSQKAWEEQDKIYLKNRNAENQKFQAKLDSLDREQLEIQKQYENDLSKRENESAKKREQFWLDFEKSSKEKEKKREEERARQDRERVQRQEKHARDSAERQEKRNTDWNKEFGKGWKDSFNRWKAADENYERKYAAEYADYREKYEAEYAEGEAKRNAADKFRDLQSDAAEIVRYQRRNADGIVPYPTLRAEYKPFDDKIASPFLAKPWRDEYLDLLSRAREGFLRILEIPKVMEAVGLLSQVTKFVLTRDDIQSSIAFLKAQYSTLDSHDNASESVQKLDGPNLATNAIDYLNNLNNLIEDDHTTYYGVPASQMVPVILSFFKAENKMNEKIPGFSDLVDKWVPTLKLRNAVRDSPAKYGEVFKAFAECVSEGFLTFCKKHNVDTDINVISAEHYQVVEVLKEFFKLGGKSPDDENYVNACGLAYFARRVMKMIPMSDEDGSASVSMSSNSAESYSENLAVEEFNVDESGEFPAIDNFNESLDLKSDTKHIADPGHYGTKQLAHYLPGLQWGVPESPELPPLQVDFYVDLLR